MKLSDRLKAAQADQPEDEAEPAIPHSRHEVERPRGGTDRARPVRGLEATGPGRVVRPDGPAAATTRRCREEQLDALVVQEIGRVIEAEQVPLSSSPNAPEWWPRSPTTCLGLGAIERYLADPTVTEVMVNACDGIYVERERRAHAHRVALPLRRSPPPGHRAHRVARSVAVSTSRRRWSTPASPTAPASTRSFRRSPSTARCSRSGSSHARRIRRRTSSDSARSRRSSSSSSKRACSGKLNILDQRRYRHRQDDAAQRRLELHPRERAGRHHRGRGRAQAHPAPRRPSREAAHRTSRARVRSRRGNSSGTRCACGPIESSSARFAVAEALDMLQAMNTGHDGSLSTLHCNTPRDALARLETMVLMAGMDLPVRAIREQVASAVDVIIHLTRMRDGTPPRHPGDRGLRHGGRHHHARRSLQVRLRAPASTTTAVRSARSDRPGCGRSSPTSCATWASTFRPTSSGHPTWRSSARTGRVGDERGSLAAPRRPALALAPGPGGCAGRPRATGAELAPSDTAIWIGVAVLFVGLAAALAMVLAPRMERSQLSGGSLKGVRNTARSLTN